MPTVAPPAECLPSDYATRLLALTNEARLNAGLNPVIYSCELQQSAQGHATAMATQGFFSHTGADGSSLAGRILATGFDFQWAGENLAGGATTPERAFELWMQSPGHKRNIMQPLFSHMGVGHYVAAPGASKYGTYWVQNFGRVR